MVIKTFVCELSSPNASCAGNALAVGERFDRLRCPVHCEANCMSAPRLARIPDALRVIRGSDALRIIRGTANFPRIRLFVKGPNSLFVVNVVIFEK